uniref:t-SNARE coiled-coil homology domain-containing protein n=1 Tax=Chromera velia CCMP2878 TaxID=1169474 RepID=A0A0G4GD04_9ALVE|eukprot:Cvel_21247.t1-p1 / transcript=Cvel_21247.t1 / gene=Cvel_21247 / organism=Chromera_velia_CCMP2878 / gene_product=hypothetical protein / transcript_product=hypothetical protein / location=Cvel_scaffold1976:23092-25953(+) / protein_length=258 / sequence_SO=supercontig / SO=protein_coding / is_pseudo=false
MDLFSTDYEKAKSLIKQVASEIRKRDSGKPGKARQSAVIRGQLSQLAQELAHLEQSIGITPDLPRAEASRRRDKVAKLQEDRQALLRAYQKGLSSKPSPPGSTAASSSSKREDLLNVNASSGCGEDSLLSAASSSFSASGMDPSGRGGDLESGEGGGPLSREQLMAKHDQAMMDQEQQLEELEGSVHTLKTVGGCIGEEIDLHCRLLDDVSSDTDKVQEKMKRNQKSLGDLMQRQSTTCLWLAILVLAVTLILNIAIL